MAPPIVETKAEQLDRWVRGESVHVRSSCGKRGVQCCPDYSCCYPNLLQPNEVREAFVTSHEREKKRLAALFLSTWVASRNLPLRFGGVV